jgi:hypothetical protein
LAKIDGEVNGSPYMVMEFVDLGSLDSFLEENISLDPKELLWM